MTLDSEPLGQLRHLAGQGKRALQLAITDPGRLAYAFASKFGRAPKTTQTSNALAVTKTKPKRSYSGLDSLPIVFIHRSNSGYLKYSLGQAKASNPRSLVFLLGDASNDVYDFVEHHSIDDYLDGAGQFGNIYAHYSTNGMEFELICFQRWFILRDFLLRNNIPQCLYVDSDTMLYADVTEDRKKFDRFDFTLCWNTIGCVFFLNRLNGLNKFCQFLLDIYSKKDRYHYDKMVSHYAVRRKNSLPGGACDMTALLLYNEAHFGRIGEASHVVDGSVYDPNINMPNPGFEMSNGIKKVIWKNQQPYGIWSNTGEEIKFNSLHFNGQAKNLMSQYCTADSELDVPSSLKDNLQSLAKDNSK